MSSCPRVAAHDPRAGRAAAGLARSFVPAASIGLLVLMSAGIACAKDEPCDSAAACLDTLHLRTGGFVPLYRSLPFDPNPAVVSAVVVIHGNRRDADRYFERLIDAARLEGRSADVALLAPNFRTLKDGPALGEHFWSSSGWKIGNKSQDNNRVSAFSVMNELLERICRSGRSTFPGLERVVVIGHSAGGQFVNRYATGGAGCSDPAVEVRYVVMNPSSYLYVDGRRPAKESGAFVVPETSCDDYDEYKYGLQNLNSYMKAVGVVRIRENLFRRRVYYLAGDADTRLGGSLDMSCRGNLQGANRLARFENYRSYRELFENWTGSVFETVPGVGHSGGAMLKSEAARRITFH